jgi:hypothetical protein
MDPSIVKIAIEQRTDAQMLSEFPRRSRTPDWFLRVSEVSNGHWVVVARDRWGREVSRSGGDSELEAMIEDCEDYASSTSQTFGPGTKEKYEAMTVNERLLVAGLLNDFDQAVRTADQAALRRILREVRLSDENVDAILKRVLPSGA